MLECCNCGWKGDKEDLITERWIEPHGEPCVADCCPHCGSYCDFEEVEDEE